MIEEATEVSRDYSQVLPNRGSLRGEWQEGDIGLRCRPLLHFQSLGRYSISYSLELLKLSHSISNRLLSLAHVPDMVLALGAYNKTGSPAVRKIPALSRRGTNIPI